MATIPVTADFNYNISSLYDILKPEYANKVFLKYAKEGLGLQLILRSMGMEEPVMQDTYNWFEREKSRVAFHSAGNVVAPGAGNPITIRLSAADFDANGGYFPQTRQLVWFPLSNVVGWVHSITGTYPTVDLVIRPCRLTDDIGAVSTNDEIAIYSSTYSEQSDIPQGHIVPYTKLSNDCQIIKTSGTVSGSEFARSWWFDKNSDGGVTDAWNEQLASIELNHYSDIDGAMWLGQRIDNTANRAVDATTGMAYMGMQGLIPVLNDRGSSSTYTLGAYTIDDFDAYDRILEREYVAEPLVLMMMGSGLYRAIENKLKTYLVNTQVDFTKQVVNDRLFNSNDSLAATVNFKYFTKSDRTFMFKRIVNFSNPETFGITHSNMENIGVVVPMTSTTDAVSGAKLKNLTSLYRAKGGTNRKINIDMYSGAAGTPGIKVSTIDADKVRYQSHVSLRTTMANQMILVQPV